MFYSIFAFFLSSKLMASKTKERSSMIFNNRKKKAQETELIKGLSRFDQRIGKI